MADSLSNPDHTPARGEALAEMDASSDMLVFDRASVRAVDHAAIHEYDIPGIVLMENAALNLLSATLDLLEEIDVIDPVVLIVCGSGNNGGDGYALARHLHNAGVSVLLVKLSEPKPGSDAATNADICKKMNLPELSIDEFSTGIVTYLLIDALLGTGLDRPVEGRALQLIETMNQHPAPILSVDIPSGLDCDTGKPLGAAVHAEQTVTFVGLKKGFCESEALEYVGEVLIADIGAPIELLERFGTKIDIETNGE